MSTPTTAHSQQLIPQQPTALSATVPFTRLDDAPGFKLLMRPLSAPRG